VSKPQVLKLGWAKGGTSIAPRNVSTMAGQPLINQPTRDTLFKIIGDDTARSNTIELRFSPKFDACGGVDPDGSAAVERSVVDTVRGTDLRTPMVSSNRSTRVAVWSLVAC
jgi:hypothetical protein